MSAKPSEFPRDERFRDPQTAPFRDEQGGYHVFSYADVMRVLLNGDQAFSQDFSSQIPADHHMSFDFMWATEPFTIDGGPGRHGALRAVVEPWFRTRAVRTMEPVVRELARDLIREIVARGTGELNLARDLGYRLSMRVICRLAGLELEREAWLREKLDEFTQAASYAELPRQLDLEAYFWSIIAKRAARPQDELLDVLVGAWRADELSDQELLGYLSGFMIAGSDTTGTSLVNSFALLDEFGYLDYARDRVDDAEGMRRIVEEVLRFGTPFPVKRIYVVRETELSGLSIPAGSLLHAWLVAANRDEAVNGGVEQTPPTVFDPARWPNRHVALGHGRHYCLGGELARLETRILLQEGLRRLPGLELDSSRPFTRFAGIVDGVTEAHFRFDVERARHVERAESQVPAA